VRLCAKSYFGSLLAVVYWWLWQWKDLFVVLISVFLLVVYVCVFWLVFCFNWPLFDGLFSMQRGCPTRTSTSTMEFSSPTPPSQCLSEQSTTGGSLQCHSPTSSLTCKI
jgi:hypothetical protein